LLRTGERRWRFVQPPRCSLVRYDKPHRQKRRAFCLEIASERQKSASPVRSSGVETRHQDGEFAHTTLHIRFLFGKQCLECPSDNGKTCCSHLVRASLRVPRSKTLPTVQPVKRDPTRTSTFIHEAINKSHRTLPIILVKRDLLPTPLILRSVVHFSSSVIVQVVNCEDAPTCFHRRSHFQHRTKLLVVKRVRRMCVVETNHLEMEERWRVIEAQVADDRFRNVIHDRETRAQAEQRSDSDWRH